MINIVFFSSGVVLSGYHMTGHSGYADEGEDIVCASVSSAAYMTANTVTEILHLSPTISVADADMLLEFQTMSDAEEASAILRGFLLHVQELQKQYPRFIKVTISEV